MSAADDLVDAYGRARARARAAAAEERQLLIRAVAALAGQQCSVRQVAARLGVSKSTVHRVLAALQRGESGEWPAETAADRRAAAGTGESPAGTNPPASGHDRTHADPARPGSSPQRRDWAGGGRGGDRELARGDYAARAQASNSRGRYTPARRRTRKRWFVVETKSAHRDDLERAVVVMSEHASEAGALRGRARLWRRGVPEGVAYLVRPEDQIRRRLEWDPTLRRGVTRDGPPPR